MRRRTRRTRRTHRLAVLAALACAIPVASARADFTSDTLISGSFTIEADYAFDPAISADGRYVAFTGSVAGVAALYRKDLQTGALDLVAAGNAGAPSISADGRFVSFTTTATNPSTGIGTHCSSVYVRDMEVAPAAIGAYALASALDGTLTGGTVTGLTYRGSGPAGSACPGGGSSAAPRVALSADGRQVAFTVVGASNLMTGGSATTTPPAQVVVRNLDTLRTTLVSQELASLGGGPVANGAAMTDNSTVASTGTGNADAGDSTAAISADGTTVAWLGINIPAQAPAASTDSPVGYPNEYDEPLWRRIADGPGAPTRRIIGGDDPTGPCPGGCVGPLDTQWQGPTNQGNNTGPDRGSFIAYTGFLGARTTSASTLSSATPQLSADGRTVALLSTQPATGQDPVYTTSAPLNPSTNAYVVNMAPGLSRSQALTRMTAWGSNNFDSPPLAGQLQDIAISPEGDRVAFVTARTLFPYSPPALITPQLTQVAGAQLYVADLADGTLQLASSGYDGQPANNDVMSPTFSASNGPIAFASSATNLVYGAFGRTGGPETFVTTEVKPPTVPGVQAIGPAPPNPRITPRWAISATVRRGPHGSVLLDVSVPSSGHLRAAARAAVPSAPKPARKASRKRARGPSSVRTRTLAGAAAAPRAAGVVELHLRPAARYRSLISRLHGLYATITVRFRRAGRRTLTQTLPVDFLPLVKRVHRRAVRTW